MTSNYTINKLPRHPPLHLVECWCQNHHMYIIFAERKKMVRSSGGLEHLVDQKVLRDHWVFFVCAAHSFLQTSMCAVEMVSSQAYVHWCSAGTKYWFIILVHLLWFFLESRKFSCLRKIDWIDRNFTKNILPLGGASNMLWTNMPIDRFLWKMTIIFWCIN